MLGPPPPPGAQGQEGRSRVLVPLCHISSCLLHQLSCERFRESSAWPLVFPVPSWRHPPSDACGRCGEAGEWSLPLGGGLGDSLGRFRRLHERMQTVRVIEGPGMSPDSQRSCLHAFHPRNGDQLRHRQGRGRGLGLGHGAW